MLVARSMRRAIQLRIAFSWVREGGKEGEARRQHDGDQVEGGIMIVPGYDHQEMEQGVGDQETRAGNCRGPISGPPDACGKRQTGDKECCAYVLDEVRVIGTGLQTLPARSRTRPRRPTALLFR